VSVVEELAAPPRSAGWGATYRIGADQAWAECRLLDITLTGARVELSGDVPDDAAAQLPFTLQIDSIADDEVGIAMQAVIEHVERAADGTVVADVEFHARREERLLLHLLVRLHALV
jgi:hypothetical protein